MPFSKGTLFSIKISIYAPELCIKYWNNMPHTTECDLIGDQYRTLQGN